MSQSSGSEYGKKSRTRRGPRKSSHLIKSSVSQTTVLETAGNPTGVSRRLACGTCHDLGKKRCSFLSENSDCTECTKFERHCKRRSNAKVTPGQGAASMPKRAREARSLLDPTASQYPPESTNYGVVSEPIHSARSEASPGSNQGEQTVTNDHQHPSAMDQQQHGLAASNVVESIVHEDEEGYIHPFQYDVVRGSKGV